MEKPKIDLFIESFQTMNLSLLDVLLDDSKTYQDARKAVFLQKTEEAFQQFKDSGDTHLLCYPGYCGSCICPNKGSSGYSFVGNNSKKHIDLIVELIDNDINDIFHCNEFQTKEKSILKAERIDITIKEEEMSINENNPAYFESISKYTLAINELSQYKNEIIKKEIYLSWLKKHKQLYNSLDFLSVFGSDISSDFYWLYKELDALLKYLPLKNQAIEALDKYQQIDVNDEKQLLKWLTDFEKLGQILLIFMHENIDYTRLEDAKYLKIKNLKIAIDDYIDLKKFRSIFIDYYYEMLKEYRTSTEEDFDGESIIDSEDTDYESSLTYHLMKKGIKLE